MIIAVAAVSQVDDPLRVDSVVPLAGAIDAAGPAVIWSDDFDGPERGYTESAGGTDNDVGFGGSGRAMVCLYPRGEQGVATRNRPAAHLAVSSSAESGWWICVETRVKLNTPGLRDGLMQLWIDGRLECERTGLDWRGRYTGHGLNAVFLEAYWNEGSPQTQTRWLDNFVISTRPIGPIVAPRRPTLLLGGQDREPGRTAWQAEVAGPDSIVVWQSKPVRHSGRITVDSANGTFVGPLVQRDRLAANSAAYCRVCRIDAGGNALPWSHWHQAFRTASN